MRFNQPHAGFANAGFANAGFANAGFANEAGKFYTMHIICKLHLTASYFLRHKCSVSLIYSLIQKKLTKLYDQQTRTSTNTECFSQCHTRNSMEKPSMSNKTYALVI
jgi:hypothetical protein